MSPSHALKHKWFLFYATVDIDKRDMIFYLVL